jgi:hypothetical protein
MKVIVTTTISPPTKAARLFDKMPDWHLVVVGDKKTPEEYELENGTYLSPKEQEAMDSELSGAIGWNCIQRRNFGFLWAHKAGAEVVATVDDDNVPLPGWGENLLVGTDVEVNLFDTDLPAFDPVGATNYPHLWHRGFPLQLLPRRDYSRVSRKVIRPEIQADFWNGDPDIDAICRMEHDPTCDFDRGMFPMASTAIAPFNSQNTFLAARILPDYFLFPWVGRMDDIWGAYRAQALGATLVFGAPSVVQERHWHDPVDDMKKEYLGYQHNLEIVEQIRDDPDCILRFAPPLTARSFELYRKHFS